MRILVVDDDQTLARAVVGELRRHGYDADSVATGREAIRAHHTDGQDSHELRAMMPSNSARSSSVRLVARTTTMSAASRSYGATTWDSGRFPSSATIVWKGSLSPSAQTLTRSPTDPCCIRSIQT